MHSFLTEQTVRRVSGWCALVSLIFAMGMAFEYGRAMSWLHAGTLGLLAIAVPVAFVGSDLLRANGRKLAATMLLIAGTLMSIGEYATHFGYTVGARVGDAQQTGVQNTNYKAIQDNRAAEASNMVVFKDQLAALTKERADLISAAPWAATVKPDGLKAELAALKERMVAEEAGQRDRKAGRGKEFEKLQNAAVDVEKRISAAERFSEIAKEIDKKTAQIEATQRILDKKTDTAVKTEFHSSKIVNQTAGFAQIAMWDDKPSESALSWVQLILGAGIAFITTYLTLVFTTVAFGSSGKVEARASPSFGPRYSTPVMASGNHAITITDERAVRDVMDRILAARQSLARYGTA